MDDAVLTLGLVGCGGMGLRHVHGLAELQRAALSPFTLAAVCDARREAATRAADLAQEVLGRRPEVHTALDDLLAGPSGRLLDVVDLVTDVGTHHSLGVPVLQAGKHLLCEKPLGLTVRACRLLVEAAARAGTVLATAENYRRDPINRLVAALLRGGVIGRPFMALQESVGGGRAVTITPWRHVKERGGIVVDMGVHYTDLWRYFLGPIERIAGRVALFEPLRHAEAMSGPMAAYYAGAAATPGPVRATAEDTAAGQVAFAGGAIGQWLLSLAGHGEGYFLRRFYGSEGALDAPADRSGRPVRFAGAAQ
ncbi:MAG TPA: Gfo/Idh/MocA family oxidoreductase, partial [Chloroflexota bacterium]|nr:Gfo/Idh/MocA family oxidoreductase [Chloroflexota bacterium]